MSTARADTVIELAEILRWEVAGTKKGAPPTGEVLARIAGKSVGVHGRLIGQSPTTELALGRLTRERPDGQDTAPARRRGR
jgi:hypothetical protein